MRESRNPFRLRAAEHIESDTTFLRLFEPAILEALPTDCLEKPLLLLRSAPGGGKTSLLRLFTPGALLTARANAHRDEYRELAQRLRSLGALTDYGPAVLGTRLSCAQTYAMLDGLDATSSRQDRLLFALLNARIFISVIREAAAIARLDVRQDVSKLLLSEAAVAAWPNESRAPRDVAALFAWARDAESAVCDALDSFAEAPELRVPGQSYLFSLNVLAGGFTGEYAEMLPARSLVMLDDLQLLTERQRQRLIEEITRQRANVSVWLAERYEALGEQELLAIGEQSGRDSHTVYLERFWRERGGKKVENFLRSVADRRAQTAADTEIRSFDACLDFSLEGSAWDRRLAVALAVVAERVRRSEGSRGIFTQWIATQEQKIGTPQEQLLGWRTLEILIERERRRQQLAFEIPLSPADLEEREGADVKRAAELFLAREFQLPYYYGPPMLASLASFNVEQYLALAGDLFEEIVSAALLRHPLELKPERQDALIRRAASERWKTIPTRLASGNRARSFLEAAGRFAEQVTYRSTAPYSPGVTGIAYAMSAEKELHERYPDLLSVLSAAIADNLLEPIPNYSVKGQRFMVLYFNRLLCAQFNLPLGYGGFRERRLAELHRWLTHGSAAIQGNLLLREDE